MDRYDVRRGKSVGVCFGSRQDGRPPVSQLNRPLMLLPSESYRCKAEADIVLNLMLL